MIWNGTRVPSRCGEDQIKRPFAPTSHFVVFLTLKVSGGDCRKKASTRSHYAGRNLDASRVELTRDRVGVASGHF